MTDYLPLLSRAISGLERNTTEIRRAIYDRARQALVNQLRGMNPPLAESEITRERLALEEAIRRVEMQASRDDRAAARPPQPQPKPPPAWPQAALPVAPEESEADAIAPEDGGADVAVPVADEGGSAPLDASTQEIRIDPPLSEFDPAYARDLHVDSIDEPADPQTSRSIDFAKADARKARQAKMFVTGIVVALLLVASLIGYVHRDRVLASIGLGEVPTVAATDALDASKTEDRVGPGQTIEDRVPTGEPGTTAPGSAVAVAQRATLYEENPGNGGEQLQTFVGTAVWKTETVNPGPGRPPELGIRIEAEIPDRKMQVIITLRRNTDEALPASHTIEVQFLTPDDPFGGVANLPGIRAKTSETAQGAPLVGLVVRVLPGFFLVGLSAVDADREQNLSLLRERGWLDIPFVYNNGRRAVLVIEKGTPGERAVNEAVMAWGG